MGKVVEIDEKSRPRNEFVRARIAYRDVKAVPGVVESSLGLFIYDFFFEREVQKDEEEEKLSNEVKVDDNTHHTAKRA